MDPFYREEYGRILLHDARRAGRTTPNGDFVPLEEQDRSLWDPAEIEEGLALAADAMQAEAPGAYAIQAAIAAEHARARVADDTRWRAIADLYRRLMEIRPSPIVELNRAVSVSMADGYEAGLEILERLKASRELDGHYLLHAVEADLMRRLGRRAAAAISYRRALDLVGTEPERRFLSGRLEEMSSLPDSGVAAGANEIDP